MDNKKDNILVSIGIFMVLKHIIVLVMAVSKTVIYQYNIKLNNGSSFIWTQKEGGMEISSAKWICAQYLFGSYSARMFQDRLRVSKPIFIYLSHLLGPI